MIIQRPVNINVIDIALGPNSFAVYTNRNINPTSRNMNKRVIANDLNKRLSIIYSLGGEPNVNIIIIINMTKAIANHII